MNALPQRPVLRLEGDLFFNQLIADKTFRIQVTHECLADVFGSDGSLTGDNRALQVNMQRIVTVATQKIMTGMKSPVKVLRADFKFLSLLGSDTLGHLR
ncbi:hypothetical protein AWB70_01024 [Caballeronia cordobensis]|uniref:Uncharacterized protein n=1 Tax=Caballeronia cordobensis TaxID=1353886 RepID=A0A158FKN1_CABCO|nr:hypothetical protein [Caballeronia cordobensis]SAL20257.1 hypothetical protein AWB70_01024 [Caballeronia cordobensis]